jgi:hypothetical protein
MYQSIGACHLSISCVGDHIILHLFPGSEARGQRKTERYQNSESQHPKSLTLTDLQETDMGSGH